VKTKIWVLATVLADENAPALPAVFADEAEAWTKYDATIRAEWDNLMDADSDGPYPGDPDEAQDRIRKAIGAEWSRWELTCHDIEIPAARSECVLPYLGGGIRPRGRRPRGPPDAIQRSAICR
jgi:hypothetical protein